jgi:hypothetical protein
VEAKIMTAPPPPQSEHALRRWWGPLVVVLSGLIMLIWSWGTWPDTVTDFGRELYVPWQLSQGKVLYRDIISYFNGPLSPYTHALLFKMFGVSLRTLVVFNLLVVTLLATLLYRLIAAAAGELAATAAGVTFFILFAFAQYMVTGNYNYVCPYSYELPHGITLTVGSIACLAQWHRHGNRPWLIGAAALLGLVFLTKAEIFFAAAVTLAIAVLAEQWLRRSTSRQASIDALTVLWAALLPIVIALALLMIHLSPRDAILGLAGAWRWVGDRQLLELPYFKELAGTQDLGRTFRVIGAWTIGYLVVFGLPIAIGRVVSVQNRGWISTTVGTVWLILGFVFCDRIPWADFIRPMPLLLAGAGLFVAWQILRRRSAECFLPLLLLIWSLAMLAKMPLNAHIYHYGFALAMPATLIGVALLLGWLPRWLEQSNIGSGWPLRAAVMAALLVSFYANGRVFALFWSQKTVIVGTDGDAFRADARGNVVNAAVQELAHLSGPGDTLVVVPEGLIINYLARRENPTAQLNFTPPAIIMYGEPIMLDALRSHPPTYIILTGVDTSEYGPRFFGGDYAKDIGGWMQENYVVIRVIGARPFRDPGFGLALFRRKDR